MKSGALDALISEIRTSEIDYWDPSGVEHWMEKAFAAGKQVAFSAALHECNEEANRYAVSTQNFDAAIQVAEAVQRRWKKETSE